MSLGKIAPLSRGVLRLHGWLLMAWVAVVGLASSLLLLHVFRVHSMAIRYGAGAAAVYFFGFVLAGWWYARWWNRRKAQSAKDLPAHATQQEQLDYDQAQKDLEKKFSFLDFFSGTPLGDDPISFFFALIYLGVVLIVLLFLMPYLPVLITDALAGYLAEIVLEFVIGAVIYRRVLKPQSVDGYWTFAMRKTLLAGVFMIVVFGAAGYGLQQLNPQAQTFSQVFR